VKKGFSVMIFCLTILHVHPQSVGNNLSAPFLYGAQFTPQVSDPFTCLYQPAALSFMKGWSAGLFSEKRYMAEGVAFMKTVTTYGTGSSGFGISWQYSGNAYYNDMLLGAAYGMSLGNISLGTLIHYKLVRVPGYYSATLTGLGLSSLWKISENVYTSLRVFNPLFISSDHKMRMASEYGLGIGYQVSSGVYAGLELMKEEGKPVHVLSCLNYRFAEQLFARLCWDTGNNQPFFSAGFLWNDITFEIGTAFHSSLGASPCITLVYNRNSRQHKQ
jgi:hypothetical protein